jgi:4-amino-4-deoxy-L-arabinose transferase-like glycosyltransferase
VPREWPMITALMLFAALLRVPSLAQPFDNDSGSFAYHARLITRGEPLYGTHHPAHHLPAVYYTFAAAFAALGDSVGSVKLVLIVWTMITTALVYRLGALASGETCGFLAAMFYALLSSHVGLYGSTAEIELFANLPRTAAVLTVVYLVSRGAYPHWFLTVGLCGAAAFLFKPVYLAPLGAAAAVLLLDAWRTRATGRPLRTMITRGVWVGIGFLVGVAPVVLYFASVGLLARLLLVFAVGQEYVRFMNAMALGYPYVVLLPLLGLGRSNALLLILGLCGAVRLAVDMLARRIRAMAVPVPILGVLVWFLLSFVESGISRVFFLHYYLVIVPPLAILAAWFLVRVRRDIKRFAQVPARVVNAGLVVLVAAVLVNNTLPLNWAYYSTYIAYKLGQPYEQFLTRGWSFKNMGSEFLQVQQLASYIREHTQPDDRVYCWSGHVELYYLADRRCSIDMIWPKDLESRGGRGDVFDPRTRYVIVDEIEGMPRPEWLYAGLGKDFVLETTMHGQEVYRRLD